jgi:hypothetical protein
LEFQTIKYAVDFDGNLYRNPASFRRLPTYKLHTGEKIPVPGNLVSCDTAPMLGLTSIYAG